MKLGHFKDRINDLTYDSLLWSSPDGLTKNYVIEIKCPMMESTVKNYLSLVGIILF